MKTKNDIIKEWTEAIEDIIGIVKESYYKDNEWSDFILGNDKDDFIDKVNELITESIDEDQDVIYTYNAKQISGIIGIYDCFDEWDLTGEKFDSWSQCAFANIYDLIQENICIDELIRQELINDTLQLN